MQSLFYPKQLKALLGKNEIEMIDLVQGPQAGHVQCNGGDFGYKGRVNGRGAFRVIIGM
jgi:hypothetical protein